MLLKIRRTSLKHQTADHSTFLISDTFPQFPNTQFLAPFWITPTSYLKGKLIIEGASPKQYEQQAAFKLFLYSSAWWYGQSQGQPEAAALLKCVSIHAKVAVYSRLDDLCSLCLSFYKMGNDIK